MTLIVFADVLPAAQISVPLAAGVVAARRGAAIGRGVATLAPLALVPDMLTVKVNVFVPLFPSVCVTSLIDNDGCVPGR